MEQGVENRQNEAADLSLRAYEGSLGTFFYDPEQFQIAQWQVGNGVSRPVLRYIGSAVKKIVVPNGVVDLDYTFQGTGIVEPPRLPPTVRTARYAFANCIRLVLGALLPEGIEDVTGMYQGCTMLVSGSCMPNSVLHGSYFYDGCVSLSVPYTVSRKLQDATALYRNCKNLLFVPTLPEDISRDEMLDGCVAFHSRQAHLMY